MKSIIFVMILGLAWTSCKVKVNQNKSEMSILKEASIEVNDQSLLKILDPETNIEILAEGHEWTEGPLWIESEKLLLYADIPRNSIYSWTAEEGIKVYLKPSGFTGSNFLGSEPGANGLILDKEGNLILCQHGDRRMAKMNALISNPKPEFETVIGTYEGKRFNSPNDAVYDKAGNLYFTDPPYGLPKGADDPQKELDFQGVYRLDPQGSCILISKELSRPNGIAFSPDESTMYVANSDPEKAIWMAYTFNDQGEVSTEELFFDATHLVGKEKGLPDGMKVHDKGFIFATGPGGVFIFNKSGKHLGTIKTGQATSNCAFNDDQTALFITADSYVLRISLKH